MKHSTHDDCHGRPLGTPPGFGLSLLTFTLLLLLVACSGGSTTVPAKAKKGPGNGGGGGGGGGGGNGSLNQGSFTPEAFGYTDPRPASFQPLKRRIFKARKQEEAVVIRTLADGGLYKGSSGHVFDDALNKTRLRSIPTTGTMRQMSSCSGSWNDNPGDEFVTLGRINGKGKLLLEVFSNDLSNRGPGWQRIFSRDVPVSGQLLSVSSCMSDIDNDGYEEILVSIGVIGRTSLQQHTLVFDDVRSRGALLLNRLDGLSSTNVGTSIQAADFDDDGKDEILLSRWANNLCSVLVLEGHSTGYKPKGKWTEVGFSRSSGLGVLGVQVGNMDGDQSAEIAVSSWKMTPGVTRAEARIYDIDGAGKPKVRETLAGWLSSSSKSGAMVKLTHAVSADLNGDGIQGLLLVGQWRDSVFAKIKVLAMHLNPKADRTAWDHRNNFVNDTQVGTVTDVAVVDDDGDGKDEILIGIQDRSSSSLSVRRFEMTRMRAAKIYSLGLGVSRARFSNAYWGAATAMHLTPGDYDGENLLLESTGKKRLSLPDPMPIVLLAAAPTKAGVSQKYSGSKTGYGTVKGRTESHSVTTGNTISVLGGVKAEVPGLFSNTVQVKLSNTLSKTLKKSVTVTKTNTFFGSYDKDVIVFQGTLFLVYEYKVVGARDSKAIGKFITLDEPVSTRIYKWTVDFYNKNVPAKARIGIDVLPHKIGDPGSYMSKTQATSYSKLPGSWIDGPGLAVGQGKSSSSTGISITKSNSTTVSRSFSVGIESKWKVGSNFVGASYGINRSSAYTVSISEGSRYQGQIGDIEKEDDYREWNYVTGLLIRRIGVDAKGKTLPGKTPYQLVTWWTEPLGKGY